MTEKKWKSLIEGLLWGFAGLITLIMLCTIIIVHTITGVISVATYLILFSFIMVQFTMMRVSFYEVNVYKVAVGLFPYLEKYLNR